MKRYVLPGALAAVGLSSLLASGAFAAQGSGQSAEHRADDFVIICHYDRNKQGPNAGPHTITINRNALDKHLENHVKAAGFVGDDHEGACSEPTVEPTATTTPADEPTATPTETPPPAETATPEATATAEATLEPTATAEATLEPTATAEPD